MTTATEQRLIESDKLIRKRAFEAQMESFIHHWKPKDRFEASQFEAQLISLIRQVYEDAQQPMLDQYTRLVMSYGSPLVVKPASP